MVKWLLMDYRRNFQPGGTFFFTLVTAQRHRLFDDGAAVNLLQQVVREVKAESPFTIDAWVILPDHLHMIWTLPSADADFSPRWSKIKSQFTRRWLASGGREEPVSVGKRRDDRRGVWQPKFIEHTIRDEDDFIAHVEYTHYNPVKHGHASYPKDWALSSFHEYVKRGIYSMDWCCSTTQNDAARATGLSYKGLD